MIDNIQPIIADACPTGDTCHTIGGPWTTYVCGVKEEEWDKKSAKIR
jgi:hypothetical protein